MLRIIISTLIIMLWVCPELYGEDFELQLRKIKITDKNQGVFPEVELVASNPVGLKDQPRYRSERPMRFVLDFGWGRTIAFAVDEKKGPGKGYDLLYADLAGTGSMKKAKKLKGKSTSNSSWYERLKFPSFTLSVPGKDGEGKLELPVQARFSKYKSQAKASLYLTPLCVMEGDIMIDGTKAKMIIFDANCNGIFGEKGSASGSKISGDTIWIGRGAPKLETASAEAIPLGKYYCFDGEFYEITFTDLEHVDIRKTELPLGTIKVSQPGFLLELVQDDGVIYISNEKGCEARVPVGKYHVNSAGFRCRYKGKIWTLDGEPVRGIPEQFTVKEDGVATVEVGPPLKLKINTRFFTRGGRLYASHDFSIKGSNGEQYRYLRKDGRRVKLPEIVIRNSRNKIVDKGKFEYG